MQREELKISARDSGTEGWEFSVSLYTGERSEIFPSPRAYVQKKSFAYSRDRGDSPELFQVPHLSWQPHNTSSYISSHFSDTYFFLSHHNISHFSHISTYIRIELAIFPYPKAGRGGVPWIIPSLTTLLMIRTSLRSLPRAGSFKILLPISSYFPYISS